MMLSWHDAAELAQCVTCACPWTSRSLALDANDLEVHGLSTVFLTMAVCPPLENWAYLAEFWTFAYAREGKCGRTY